LLFARGATGFGGNIPLRYFEIPALELSACTVVVAASDAVHTLRKIRLWCIIQIGTKQIAMKLIE
jgi:hypothetical protein